MKNLKTSQEELLEVLLKELEKTNEDNEAAGACIYTPPSGRPVCLQMTSEQCSAIHGVYIGGPCSKIKTNEELSKRISKIKEDTVKVTGIKMEDLSYITPEFLLEADKSDVKILEKSDGDANGDVKKLDQWGTYGNSYWFEGDLCKWKQNKKGTPNYGCGTDETWEAGKNWCSNIYEKGKCADGKKWYFLGNYNG